jgi:hypothetical protein
MQEPPPQRVAPVVFPRRWELPGRPTAPPEAVDAYRQTEFALRTDLQLLETGMNLQLKIVEETYPAPHRTLPAAAYQLYWSRAFHALSDAAALVVRGSYVSVPALARTACECLAAAVQLGGGEHEMFLDFLHGALRPDERFHAINIGRGSYLAGGTLAAVERLGYVYRIASELSRPGMGATLLAAAPESNRQRLAVLFGDQAFHLGWAQLTLGWLLALCAVALDLATADGTPLHCSAETRAAIAGYQREIDAALADPQRCAVQEVESDGERRLLVVNFRRQTGGAPQKLLL